jgi:phosphoribosylformylglycinamidine synthase
VEAVEDLLNYKFSPNQAVYTSKRYCIKGQGLCTDDLEKIAGELLANQIIQLWKIFSAAQWDAGDGIGYVVPKVELDHIPTVTTIPADNDKSLQAVSDERNLALNPNDT